MKALSLEVLSCTVIVMKEVIIQTEMIETLNDIIFRVFNALII